MSESWVPLAEAAEALGVSELLGVFVRGDKQKPVLASKKVNGRDCVLVTQAYEHIRQHGPALAGHLQICRAGAAVGTAGAGGASSGTGLAALLSRLDFFCLTFKSWADDGQTYRCVVVDATLKGIQNQDITGDLADDLAEAVLGLHPEIGLSEVNLAGCASSATFARDGTVNVNQILMSADERNRVERLKAKLAATEP